jgi:hypothetical protein
MTFTFQGRSGLVSVEDDKHSGQWSTSKTTESVEKFEVSSTKTAEHSMSSRHHWDQLWSLPADLNRTFNMRHIAAKFFPRLLRNDQKQQHVNMRLELLEKANEDAAFISRIIMGDESWISGYDPETKQQLSQWKNPQSPSEKKGVAGPELNKDHLLLFLDVKEIVHCEFVSPNTSVNSITFTATFWDAWEKMCDEWDRNSGTATAGSFITTTRPLTRPWNRRVCD